jgi:hypothetical protein
VIGNREARRFIRACQVSYLAAHGFRRKVASEILGSNFSSPILSALTFFTKAHVGFMLLPSFCKRLCS